VPDGRSEPLELLSAIYNGDWQPVALPVEGVDLGHHLPYARVSFGLEALETRRPDARDVAAILSIKDYPDTTRAGLVDAMLRVPAPMVLTQTYAPADRQVAREDRSGHPPPDQRGRRCSGRTRADERGA
jgi:type IV secretion system protein VirB4